jgi:hypothetical protein
VPAGALLLAVLLTLSGCGSSASADRPGPGGPSASPSDRASDAAIVGGFRSSRRYLAVAAPVRLRIPAAGVRTALEPLGLAADGTIALPSRPDRAGWYAGGPRPGQPGPAVVIGHVNWSGPAVFGRLATLRAGDTVYVDRAGGSTIAFRVTGQRQVPKSRFPSDLVYGPTLEPSLRLVTCGGVLDRANRNYLDNVIVFAAPS